jgi:hypothetical protein
MIDKKSPIKINNVSSSLLKKKAERSEVVEKEEYKGFFFPRLGALQNHNA